MKKSFLELVNELANVRAHEHSLNCYKLSEFESKQNTVDDLITKMKLKYPESVFQINELIEYVNSIDAIYIEESYKVGFKDCYKFIKTLEE